MLKRKSDKIQRVNRTCFLSVWLHNKCDQNRQEECVIKCRNLISAKIVRFLVILTPLDSQTNINLQLGNFPLKWCPTVNKNVISYVCKIYSLCDGNYELWKIYALCAGNYEKIIHFVMVIMMILAPFDSQTNSAESFAETWSLPSVIGNDLEIMLVMRTRAIIMTIIWFTLDLKTDASYCPINLPTIFS